MHHMTQPVENRAQDICIRPHLFERVMDCLRERFVLIDREYKILIVNEAALPNISKKEDVVSHNLFEVYPNLLQQGFKDLIDTVFLTGNPHTEFYVRHTTIDGFTGYHHRKIIPLKNADDAVEGVIVVVENVHEERLAQLHTKQTEFEYAQLIDTLQLVSFELNASGSFVQVNNAVKPVFGYEPHELIGQSFTRRIHPDDVRGTWHIYWQIVNLGKLFGVCENRFLAVDGTYVNMRWNIHPIHGEHGSVVGCRGVGENITADQALLEEIKDSLRLCESAMQVAPMPMFIVRQDAVIKANRALLKLLHVSMRGAVPTLEEISKHLRIDALMHVCATAHATGTARVRVKVYAHDRAYDAMIVAIRIHNAIVVALEPVSAVQ
jgi:PAS domain S-box-containing protein